MFLVTPLGIGIGNQKPPKVWAEVLKYLNDLDNIEIVGDWKGCFKSKGFPVPPELN